MQHPRHRRQSRRRDLRRRAAAQHQSRRHRGRRRRPGGGVRHHPDRRDRRHRRHLTAAARPRSRGPGRLDRALRRAPRPTSTRRLSTSPSAPATSRCTPHGGPYEAAIAIGGALRLRRPRPGLAERPGPARRARGLISNPTPFSFVLTASRSDDRRAYRRPGRELHRRRSSPDQRDPPVRSAPLRLPPPALRLRRRVRLPAQRRPPLVCPRRHRRLHRVRAKNFLLFKNLDDVEYPTHAGAPSRSIRTIRRLPRHHHARRHADRRAGDPPQPDLCGRRPGPTSATCVTSTTTPPTAARPSPSTQLWRHIRRPARAVTYDNITTPNFPIFTLPDRLQRQRRHAVHADGIVNEDRLRFRPRMVVRRQR